MQFSELVVGLFERELVVDDFFVACRPLLEKSVSPLVSLAGPVILWQIACNPFGFLKFELSGGLLPWMFASLFLALKLSPTSRGGGGAPRQYEKALASLSRAFNALLDRRPCPILLEAILTALHKYSQWLIRRG